jgi:hypothetical protein
LSPGNIQDFDALLVIHAYAVDKDIQTYAKHSSLFDLCSQNVSCHMQDSLSLSKKVHMLQSSLVLLLVFEEQHCIVKFWLGFTTERASKLYIATFAEE